jgi:hypothetical protein
MHKLPGFLDKNSLQVIVWIHHGILRTAISHFQILHLFIVAIQQLVGITRSRLESRTRTRRKLRFSLIRDQHWVVAQNVDELILF